MVILWSHFFLNIFDYQLSVSLNNIWWDTIWFDSPKTRKIFSSGKWDCQRFYPDWSKITRWCDVLCDLDILQRRSNMYHCDHQRHISGFNPTIKRYTTNLKYQNPSYKRDTWTSEIFKWTGQICHNDNLIEQLSYSY